MTIFYELHLPLLKQIFTFIFITMKKNYFYLILVFILGSYAVSSAQVDPGTTNLKHKWTFDNGSAVDEIGLVEGTLQGAASLSGNALNTLGGGYFDIPAATIGVNNYTAFSQQIWFTSSTNPDNCSLSFFGNTTGTYGTDYILAQTTHWGADTRTSISCLSSSSPWNAEDGVNTAKITDEKLHHLVSTIDDKTIKLYLDGIFIGVDTLSVNNSLANVGTQFVYLCKAGYTGDPTWKGLIHQFTIYDKSLTDAEVLYLYQQGAEENAVMNATKKEIALDTFYPAETFNVSSANLAEDITVTAPNGIVVMPTTITKNLNDQEVAVIWDGTAPADGEIVLKSGGQEVRIRVKSADDSGCYSPLFPDDVNFVLDPGLNSLASFAGWGTKKVSTVINDPANVYCGASSIAIGDSVNTGSGSLDVGLTGLMEPNTTYRVKCMIKTLGGTFQLGVWGWSSGQSDINNQIDTYGEWMPIDFTFTTGASLGGTQGMFINNWGCSGIKAYADNWEMYQSTEPVISASHASLAFDPEYKSSLFTVTADNLTEAAALTAPAGITLGKSSIELNVDGKIINDTVTVVWDGTTEVNGAILIATSSKTIEIPVRTTSASNTDCFLPSVEGKVNLAADPYCNDLSKFSGWGTRIMVDIASSPDSVYCGSHSIKIVGSGSLDQILSTVLQRNSTYLARAMVRTIGGTFQIGTMGNVTFTILDQTDTIDTQGQWMPFELQFETTDTIQSNAGIYINNYQKSGNDCYIDNFEIYQMFATGVEVPVANQSKVFMHNGRIATEFNAETAAPVSIQVYDISGSMIYNESYLAQTGKNLKKIQKDLTAGVYMVKMTIDNKTEITKIVK